MAFLYALRAIIKGANTAPSAFVQLGTYIPACDVRFRVKLGFAARFAGVLLPSFDHGFLDVFTSARCALRSPMQRMVGVPSGSTPRAWHMKHCASS